MNDYILFENDKKVAEVGIISAGCCTSDNVMFVFFVVNDITKNDLRNRKAGMIYYLTLEQFNYLVEHKNMVLKTEFITNTLKPIKNE